jgi:hypothetical protein
MTGENIFPLSFLLLECVCTVHTCYEMWASGNSHDTPLEQPVSETDMFLSFYFQIIRGKTGEIKPRYA